MEKNNCSLKNVFMLFSIAFGVSGIFFICLIFTSGADTGIQEVDAPRMMRFWVFAISLLVISIFGRCAACTESKRFLIAFAVINGIGMVVMVALGINVAVFKNQVIEKTQTAEFAKKIPNNKTRKELLHLRQEHRHCCGWTGVQDWGSDVPKSCKCTFPHEQCKPSPQGSTGPLNVYAKSCREAFRADVEHVVNVVLGIFFGFAIIASLVLMLLPQQMMAEEMTFNNTVREAAAPCGWQRAIRSVASACGLLQLPLMMCLIITIEMIKQTSCHDNVGEPDIEMRDY